MSGTAVVTGASSGIGAATIRRLVKDGLDVLREETGTRVCALDLTDEDAVRRLAAPTAR